MKGAFTYVPSKRRQVKRIAQVAIKYNDRPEACLKYLEMAALDIIDQKLIVVLVLISTGFVAEPRKFDFSTVGDCCESVAHVARRAVSCTAEWGYIWEMRWSSYQSEMVNMACL